MAEKLQLTSQDNNRLLSWISRYSILVNGKFVEHKLIGWRTALAHARRHAYDLFEPNKVVEILNIYTGEIVNIKEAERRVLKARH